MAVNATARGTTVQTTRASGTVNTPVRAPAPPIQRPTVDMIKEPHNLVRVLHHMIDRVEALARLLVNEERGVFIVHGLALTATADNTISHGLQRTPVGWQITDITGAASNIYRTSWNAQTLVLHNAGAATTISLKVW